MDQLENTPCQLVSKYRQAPLDGARSGRPSLAAMPYEIKCMIADNIAEYSTDGSAGTIKDLRHLRLVTKAFAVVVTPILFHTIPLWISRSSIANLVNISQQPAIAHHIRKIIFSPLEVTRQPYESGAHKEEREEILDARSDYVHEQRILLGTRPDSYPDLMTQAFNKMPHLDSLEVDILNEVIGLKELRDKLGTTFGPHTYFEAERTLPYLMTCHQNSHQKLKHLIIAKEMPPSTDGVRRELGDFHSRDLTVKSLAKSFHHSDGYTWKAGKIFSELRTLKLLGLNDDRSIIQDRSPVVDLLANAPNIENLTVKYEYNPVRPLSDLLGNSVHLRHLTKLQLQHITSRESEMIDFLRPHARTIEYISFDWVEIETAGGWRDVLEYLRRGVDFPMLKRFELSWWDHDEGKPPVEEIAFLEKYILGETDVNPLDVYYEYMAWLQTRGIS